MLLKLAKELTRKEKEERKQLPLNCSPTQLIEKSFSYRCPKDVGTTIGLFASDLPSLGCY